MRSKNDAIKQETKVLTPGSRRSRWVLLISMLIFATLIPGQHVFANAAPPPPEVWFVFENLDATGDRIQAVQLWSCESEACEEPLLLQEFGECQDSNCLDMPALLPDQPDTLDRYSFNSFQCAGDRCRTSSFQYHELSRQTQDETDTYAGDYYRLAVQSSMGDFSLSDTFPAVFDSGYGNESWYSVRSGWQGLPDKEV